MRAAGGRFVAGDPLRALAALSIMTMHGGLLAAAYAGGGFGAPEVILPRFYRTEIAEPLVFLQLGLYIFFALSGYLIARPFVRAFVAGDPMPAVRPYLRNRLLRIVPAFWLVFTAALLISGPLGSSLAEVVIAYLFLENFARSGTSLLIDQTWTLHVELAFYVLIPLVAAVATRLAGPRLGARGRLRLVVATTTAVYAVSLALRALDPGNSEYLRSVPPMLFAFCPGVLLVIAEIRWRDRAHGSAVARRAGLALALGGLAALVPFSALPLSAEIPRGILESLGTSAIVAGALVHQWSTGGAWRVLDNRPMHWLGERSYSIYLVHLAVFYELRSLATATDSRTAALALMIGVGGVVTVLVSALTYRIFELPFLRRRQRWRSRGSGPAAATR